MEATLLHLLFLLKGLSLHPFDSLQTSFSLHAKGLVITNAAHDASQEDGGDAKDQEDASHVKDVSIWGRNWMGPQ